MRKLMYFAAALLVLVGCNKKDNALNNAPEGTPFKKGQQVTLSVGTGDNANQAAPRKVAGIDAGSQINFTWEEGDKILVKVGGATAEFTLSSGAGLAEGEFTGIMPADGSNFDIQYPVEAPDLSAQTYSDSKKIPADKMAFAASNCTLDEAATLTAQNAMLQLNLYGTDITIGKIVFTNTTASPTVSYTLTCTDGVTIGTDAANATPFYMVVPAGVYQFEVEVYDNAATPAKICSFATSEAKTFTAGQCLNMPAKEVADPYNGHAYVDLGLPSGVKWATMNVGATAPEGNGDYFAWGETEPYYADTTTDPITWKEGKDAGYYWASYFDTNDGGSTFTKYYLNGGKTTLDLADDAAAANWKGAWRMPTKAEFQELANTQNCKWDWQENYNETGVKGYLVTSLKEGYTDNSIFLPASGYRLNSSLYNVGSGGYYWSSSLGEYGSNNAYYLRFNSDYEWISGKRYYGRSVRPVCQ